MPKKLVFLLFIMTSNSLLLSQETFIGGNLFMGPLKNGGFGLSINGEYQLSKLPFSFRLSAKVNIGDFDESPYLSRYSHVFSTVESNILYLLSEGKDVPYIGLGIGYTFVSMSLDGNYGQVDDNFVQSKDPKNAVNYNVLAGVNINAQGSLSFFAEFLYRLINIDYTSEVESQYDKWNIYQSAQVNTFFICLGLRFRL